ALFAGALSPDGTRLAVCGSPVGGGLDVPVHVIDLEKGRVERVLKGHRNYVNGLDFSRDGQRLLTACSDKVARVYDLRTGEMKTALEGHTDRLISARFSPDGARVLTASIDGTARVFTLFDNKSEHVLRASNKAGVRGVAWSRDGSALATASED